MESMEKYVRNQEDRINLLTNDYRKTLETLNKIIKDVNLKMVELDETCVKKYFKNRGIRRGKIRGTRKGTDSRNKGKTCYKK